VLSVQSDTSTAANAVSGDGAGVTASTNSQVLSQKFKILLLITMLS